jgi:hypothetical protein
VLFVFEKMLDSYGVDWTMVEAIALVTAIFIYTQIFFAIRRRSMSEVIPGTLPGGGDALTGLSGPR